MEKANILIIEDERIVARDIQHSLENLGYTVSVIVSSGEKAVEKAAKTRPDLVLMDIRLKGKMNGVEAAEQIRALLNIPVIYLTAYADDETLQRARITEPFGYILKPFEERELHSAIQIALYKHRMERKLKEREEYFRAVIENSSDVIMVLDRDGAISYASPSVEQILGYTPEETVGKKVFEFLHPDDEPWVMDEHAQIVHAQGVFRLDEGRVRHRDGSWRIFEVIARNRLDDPAVAGIVINARDVTERRQAERARHELEEKYRTLVEQSLQGVVIAQGSPLRLVFANPAASEILGYTSEELMALSSEEIYGFMYPADREIAHQQSVDILGGRSLPPREIRLTRKDVAACYVQVFSRRIEYQGEPALQIAILDITERKQAEEALRESEERFRLAFENANIGMCLVDLDGYLTRVNRQMCEIFGYSQEELESITVNDIAHPEDLDISPRFIQRATSGEIEHTQFEKRYFHKRGNIVWGQVSSSLVRDLQGAPLYFISHVQDITGHKRAEEALRESVAVLNESQAIAHIGSWELDIIANQLTWSDEAYRIFGLRPQEFDANYEAFLDAVHPDDRAAVDAAYSESLREGRDIYEIEHRIVRQDSGEVRVVHEKCRHVKDTSGRIVRSVGMVQDITERKRAEEKLWQRNRELALLNQVGQTFTGTLDLEQVLVTILKEVRRLLDVAACSIWLVYPETDELVCQQAIGPQSEIVRGWRLMLGKGIGGWVARSGESLIVSDTRTNERHFKSVDQQTGVEMRSILSVPLQVKQDVIGVLQVLDTEVDRFRSTDLTLIESLAAAAAIAIDNARLVDALHHHTAELEARNEELDAFAHTVAHDLKNPVGLVVGFANVLEEECTTMPRERLQEYLHTIAQNGRKVNNIIDELLLLAGVRKREVDVAPLDMASIVAEAQGRLAHEVEEYRAEIILPDTWPGALGYGPWVEEVWVNYLSNALRYGGQPPRMELGATMQPDGMVRFWVRDNGPGLAPEEQARLFTPFTQLNRVHAKGHGLGLSIVRRIVEKLGGQVEVASEVGQGSVFTFTLPGIVSEAE
jgi:PAS domain S-box-containing protein